MALMTSLLNILLIPLLSRQVQAFVCYIGQEPAPEKGYRWYIAEKNPCECTEFRMGGLNNKPNPGPSVVDGIHYVPFKTNEENIREVLGCEDAFESPCDRFTTLGSSENASKLVLPMEMELTVIGREGVSLYFTTENPIKTEVPFKVELDRYSYSAICSTTSEHRTLSSWYSPITGSAVMITFDGMRISVGLKGKPEPHASCNSTTLTHGDGWFIGLSSYSQYTVWSISKPCGLFND